MIYVEPDPAYSFSAFGGPNVSPQMKSVLGNVRIGCVVHVRTGTAPHFCASAEACMYAFTQLLLFIVVRSVELLFSAVQGEGRGERSNGYLRQGLLGVSV